jgi:putative DeoR family transcriptional regulator (stage III sporulation protein D)
MYKNVCGGYDMYTYIEERVLDVAQYIVEHGATVRSAARKFGISKSTVHKDMVERLLGLDPALASSVQAILKKNKEERHIRGGLATYLKYKGN